MKTIGMIGGMSWESTAHYYRMINQLVRERRGRLHSARCVLVSVDFAEIAALQHDNDWATLAARMQEAARAAQAGGADVLLICANTMHKLADDIAGAITIPLLHIAEPLAAAIGAAGLGRVGLLGTAFTMEQDFLKAPLRAHGIDCLVPEADDRHIVHRIIYDELVRGRIEPASREVMRGVIARLVARGAQGIILGCTELMLLVTGDDSAVPLFDTTVLHARAAVDFACAAPLGILGWRDDRAQAFHDINAQWIEAMFTMEPADREVLLHPRERIIEPGGDILFVEHEDAGIVGACALYKTGDGAFELTKMGVLDAARGAKAGEFLLHAAIRRAGELGADKLYLLTNAKCAAAIHLYEKLGFVHDAAIMREYGARYERCDVAMRYVGTPD